MKRHYSLRKTSEIDNIFKNKQFVGNKYFVLYYKSHEERHFKYLISIGRKYGNAVKRNKIKRQIKMILRDNKSIIKENYGFVIVVKKNASSLSYQEIKTYINKLLITSKLINKETNIKS